MKSSRGTNFTPLIDALLSPEAYDHPVDALPQVVQTHISWVILTGQFAYKIKKPVHLEFVDFSTLERRRHFCHEELRLNRRLAPQLYHDVVPITGTTHRPHVGGPGPVLEYAVRMQQFSQERLARTALEADRLRAAHVDHLAGTVARFHQQIAVAAPRAEFGSPQAIADQARENMHALDKAKLPPLQAAQLGRLVDWTDGRLAALADCFRERRRSGFIRECHGDMHLGNMIVEGDKIVIFDGIEFNDGFRWIDVMNEIAFCAMDLRACGRGDWASRFVNAYLELTGDYHGLAVLRFYTVYRALVRAKVDAIAAQQAATRRAAADEAAERLAGHLELADACTQRAAPRLWITHGLSGSGKTHGTGRLVETAAAVRLRSDIERKRLAGLAEGASSSSAIEEGLYSARATVATYDRLAELATAIVAAGYPVVVDATFLYRRQRDQFRHLARQLGVPLTILSFTASEAELRERIERRRGAAKDASEADLDVLRHQLKNQEPLGDDERPLVQPMP